MAVDRTVSYRLNDYYFKSYSSYNNEIEQDNFSRYIIYVSAEKFLGMFSREYYFKEFSEFIRTTVENIAAYLLSGRIIARICRIKLLSKSAAI